MEDIGIGSRELGGAAGIQFCCQKIDTSKAFREIMGTNVIIKFSAYAIAFGK